MNIVIFDYDVAEVYANAKFDSLVNAYPRVPLAHAALHFNGASYRVNHGRELDEHAVSGVLDDMAPMFFDFRIDQRLQMPLQLGVRAFLVHAHETAIAGHVCSENGGEPSLQALATQSTPPDRGQFTVASSECHFSMSAHRAISLCDIWSPWGIADVG
jgi:hypothetical protein